jgi:phosphatidylglycerophosphatase A
VSPDARPRRRVRGAAGLLAVGLGSGLSPVAPGTAGTLFGVPLYLAASALSTTHYLVLCAALFLVGVWACGAASRALDVHDDPRIVLDEVVGFLVAMAGTPPSWASVAAGFALFRALDILKPWPIYVLDRRLGGGLGIMLDDVLAGVWVAVVLHLARPVLERI